jgi:hypothetical protein
MEHTCGQLSMSVGIRTPNTLESDRPQHDRPAAMFSRRSILPPLWSQCTFFRSREEKSRAWYQKRRYFTFLRLQIYVRPKLGNFKLCKSGETCNRELPVRIPSDAATIPTHIFCGFLSLSREQLGKCLKVRPRPPPCTYFENRYFLIPNHSKLYGVELQTSWKTQQT